MNEPLYQKIYDAIKSDILKGRYQPGEQIPTEAAISASFGVSKITSKKALNMLTEEGFLLRQKGRGTFVSENISSLLIPARPAADPLLKIGLIFPHMNSHFGIPMVTAIADACHNRAHLLFSLSHDDEKTEEEAILHMISASVDGLIIFPGPSQFLNSHLLQMVVDKYPLVLIDQNIQAISQTSVGTDNTDAVFQALDYITKHGHQKISVMLPTISNNVLQERLDAVFQYSSQSGILLDQGLWLHDINARSSEVSEEYINMIERHLLAYPEITAVFAFHYAIAIAARRAAERIGRVIGKDLAILCFDSPQILQEKPYFTHIRQNETAIGKEAVQLVLDLIRKPDRTPKNIRIAAELVEGQSFFSISKDTSLS